MNKAYPKYEKSDRVQRSDLSQVGQWMDGSRLVHVRPDGVKVFFTPMRNSGVSEHGSSGFIAWPSRGARISVIQCRCRSL